MEEVLEKLEDTFKDVIDITEPGNMDKLLMFVQQVRTDDDEYMEILVNKLSDLEITWKQPWYQQRGRLTRKPPPPGSGQEAYEEGSLTPEEGELIEKKWQKFVSKFEVPNRPLCFARWKNRGKSKQKVSSPEERVRYFVTAYLARGLKRNLYQVYKYFLKHYGYPCKQPCYTPLEEKLMEICFYHQPQDAPIILSPVLGRECRGIYKRLFQYFKGKPTKLKLKWTLELATRLVHLLMEYSGCSFEELMHKNFDLSIWQKVEEQIGQQYSYIRQFWYGTLHVQLFAKCAIKTKSLRKIIYKKLRHSSYRIWPEICWKNLVQDFPDGFTSEFLSRVARNGVKMYEGYLTRPLPQVLAAHRADPRRRRRKRLKSIAFTKKGKLQYVEYDTPLKQLMKSCHK